MEGERLPNNLRCSNAASIEMFWELKNVYVNISVLFFCCTCAQRAQALQKETTERFALNIKIMLPLNVVESVEFW